MSTVKLCFEFEVLCFEDRKGVGIKLRFVFLVLILKFCVLRIGKELLFGVKLQRRKHEQWAPASGATLRQQSTSKLFVV